MSSEQTTRHALYLEDEDVFQEAVGAALSVAGYNVVYANNLQDAQDRVRERKFDIYVSDGQTPREKGDDVIYPFSGIDFYDWLKSFGNPFEFVFISNDTCLKKYAREEGIKFIDKLEFSSADFIRYLKSLELELEI